jgi:acyl carrier protein
MNTAEIEQKVMKFLISITGESALNADTELEESGIIDSLGMMDLLVFFETDFGVRLEIADLTPAMFQSPATISRLIESRLANGSP